MTEKECSVEKRNPPEPDLLYRAADSEPVAFELVELIDQTFAHRTGDQLKLKHGFEDAYINLEPLAKAAIQQRAASTLTHVEFDEKMTYRSKELAIRPVLDLLANIDEAYEGELHRDRGAVLPGAVRSVRITRLTVQGPFFDVDAVSSLGDPTLDSIRGKWAKNYVSPHPVELLAYYQLQPEAPEWFWRPRLELFLKNNAHNSPFRRVWVYDCGAEEIRFSSERLRAANHEA